MTLSEGNLWKVLQNMQKPRPAQEVPGLNTVGKILDKNIMFTCPLLFHPTASAYGPC